METIAPLLQEEGMAADHFLNTSSTSVLLQILFRKEFRVQMQVIN